MYTAVSNDFMRQGGDIARGAHASDAAGPVVLARDFRRHAAAVGLEAQHLAQAIPRIADEHRQAIELLGRGGASRVFEIGHDL